MNHVYVDSGTYVRELHKIAESNSNRREETKALESASGPTLKKI